MTIVNMVTRELRERPIPFTGEMVRAILDGRKTQTRRVVKLPGDHAGFSLTRMQGGYPDGVRPVFDDGDDPNAFSRRCPYGQPGDRLWVREAHVLVADGLLAIRPGVVYDADAAVRWNVPMRDGSVVFNYDKPDIWKRRPARFLRREHSRLTLEITDVRVERVQDISHDDALAEGVMALPDTVHQDVARACAAAGRSECGAVDYFARLWDWINLPRGFGWDANPWVWALTFRRVEVANG